MLSWSLTFLVIALIAGAFGLNGVAGTATDIAKGLFFIAIGLFAVTVIAGIAAGSSVKKKLSSKSHSHDDHLIHR